MLRKSIKSTQIGMNNDFTYRGEEQTRIETLSDAVFALAITLLILSSTVPTTFEKLLLSFQDLVPFAVCITLLMLVWYQHYIFFIRYGFKDVKVIVLNTILLFLVLTYVYPLKFLFKVLFQMQLGFILSDNSMLEELFTETLPLKDAPTLMVIYGFGAATVFFVLALMYRIAIKRRDSLKLTRLELFHTRSNFYNNLIMAAIPFGSALISLLNIGGDSLSFTLSGFFYWLYPIIMPLYSILRKKRKEKIFA